MSNADHLLTTTVPNRPDLRARLLRDTPFGNAPVRKVVIVTAPDGGQLRGQITGKKFVRTIQYPSDKFDCARFGEAGTEIFRIVEEEALVDVVDAVAQPLRVEALIGDVWYSHIPDFSNLRATGRRVIMDAKRSWSDFRTDDGRRQSVLGQLAADELGWDYERYVLANAGSQTRRNTVEAIQSARFVPVPDRSVGLAAAALATGPMRLGNLAAILDADPRQGERMACALMVRRVVEIDIETPLGPRSECRAVPPLPAGMPSIRRFAA